jgi:hypothetical protein
MGQVTILMSYPKQRRDAWSGTGEARARSTYCDDSIDIDIDY